MPPRPASTHLGPTERPGRAVSGTLTAVLAALAACNASAEGAREVVTTTTDSAGMAIVTINGQPTDLPRARLSGTPLTEVRGDAEPFLSDIGEVAFRSDGSLLVEDNASAGLFLFDVRGDLIRRVSGTGDGPGEIRNLTGLSVGVGDTAYAYDRRLARVTAFDPAGDLLQMIAVDREFAGRGTITWDVRAFDSDEFVLHSLGAIDSVAAPTGPRLEQRAALLHRLDAAGVARADPVAFRGGLSTMGQAFDGVSPFGNETLVAVGANRVAFGSGVEYELFVASRELETERVIRWPGWARPLDPATVQAVRDSMAARFARISQAPPERLAALLDAIFSPELIPARLPVLGQALMDDLGRIWVARFWPSTEPWRQEDSWHVLDPTGRPIARVELPARTRIGAVGRDRIALIMLDEFDVQHLRVFGVSFD